MTVLIVYPGPNVKGGMLSVVKDLEFYLNESNTEYKYFYTHGQNTSWALWSFICTLYQFIKELISNHNIESVYIHTASKGSFLRKSILSMFANVFNKKVVLHMHGGAFKEFYYTSNALLKNWIRFSLVTNTWQLVVLTQGWKDWFESEFDFTRKPVVIFNSVTRIDNLKPKVPSIVFVGRLVKEKGIEDLLLAYVKSKRNNKISLDIIGGGDGKYISELKKMICLNNVTFHGELPRRETQEFISRSIALVLPSYKEGLPIVILEAMSAKTLIIASSVGGIPEVICNEENGFLIECGDVHALSKIISGLPLGKEQQEMYTNNAYQLWQSQFTFERNFPLLLSYLKGKA